MDDFASGAGAWRLFAAPGGPASPGGRPLLMARCDPEPPDPAPLPAAATGEDVTTKAANAEMARRGRRSLVGNMELSG